MKGASSLATLVCLPASAFAAAQPNQQTNGSLAAIFGSNGTLTFHGTEASPGIVVLDYGANVEGHPTFEVLSASGDTSLLEITYSESKSVLDNFYQSDGPLALAAAMDTYRVNQYNITGPMVHTNRLIQGGFRYQKLNLSTAGEVTLRNVGVKPTIPITPLNQLSGFFECSDEDLNRIWKVGARTIQLNDIPAGSIPPFWQVSEEGVLMESQAPQVLATVEAGALTQYTLTFEVKPTRRGFAFSVLADTLSSGIYINVDMASSTISAHFDQTGAGPALASASLAGNVTLNNWHKVEAVVNMTEMAVSIDSLPTLSFSQTSSFYGSFGLGASLGHSAIFRNLSSTTLTGGPIYSASLTDDSFFNDFLTGTNPHDTTVDGSKRDRIAYAGDLDIALISSLASTYGTSYVKGTLDLLGSFQLTPGFFVPTAKIQQVPRSTPIDANLTGLIGYSFNLLTAAANFYLRTGDLEIAQEWAPRAVRMLDWADSQTLENGLLNISNPTFGGDWNYYDPTQAGVVTKLNVVYAYALQRCISTGLLSDGGSDTQLYQSRLDALRTAIDENLWSNDLGAYFLSETVSNGFSQDANAIAILAGVVTSSSSSSSSSSNSSRTSKQILQTLKQLNTPAGPPLAFSPSVLAQGFAAYISPYASAYHLRAAFDSKDDETVLTLLKSLWAPMANPSNANYTGCFWETLNSSGGPALGRATSLCHAWAAGPTGELSEHVLGVKPVTPGYREWKIEPMTLGLEWAKGRVPVPGGEIAVGWNAVDGVIKGLEVSSPQGTMGRVVLPSAGGQTFWVNGEAVAGNGTFEVVGGELFILSCTE